MAVLLSRLSMVKLLMILKGIAIRQQQRAPMHILRRVSVSPERGLEGDARGKPGSRQVTLLSEESWQAACADIGKELHWSERRANLLIGGYEFSHTDVGRLLVIGQVQLRITRETVPCRRMEEVCEGLSASLNPRWRGGICCRVIQGGTIQVGDAVQLLE